MTRPFFVALVALGLAAPLASIASADQRLGHFVGKMSSQSTLEVKGYKKQELPSSKPEAVSVRFQHDKRTKRLFVTIAPRGAVGSWRQSFIVTNERPGADGSRIIEYTRPTLGRSAKYNLKMHNAAIESLPISMLNMNGRGAVIVSRTGQVDWLNDGDGYMGQKEGGFGWMKLEWSENFQGGRKASK